MEPRWGFLIALPAVAVVSALSFVAPASADDPPAAGSSCPSDQLGEAATTPEGTTVRCLATEQNDFTWAADTGAASTIAELQKEGYTVTIDRVGSGELSACKVTSVRNPVTNTRTLTNPPGPHTPGGVTTIIVNKTISVSLDCTGS